MKYITLDPAIKRLGRYPGSALDKLFSGRKQIQLRKLAQLPPVDAVWFIFRSEIGKPQRRAQLLADLVEPCVVQHWGPESLPRSAVETIRAFARGRATLDDLKASACAVAQSVDVANAAFCHSAEAAVCAVIAAVDAIWAKVVGAADAVRDVVWLTTYATNDDAARAASRASFATDAITRAVCIADAETKRQHRIIRAWLVIREK